MKTERLPASSLALNTCKLANMLASVETPDSVHPETSKRLGLETTERDSKIKPQNNTQESPPAPPPIYTFCC